MADETLIPRLEDPPKGAAPARRDEKEYPVEEALFRAAESPEVDPLSAFAEGLGRRTRARFVVFHVKEGSRRRCLAGRWADGKPIGRPDKLLLPGDVERVAGSNEAEWIVLGEAGGVWRAGLPVGGPPGTRGAVFLEGAPPAPWEPPLSDECDPRRLAPLAGAAMALWSLKAENLRVHEEVVLLSQGCAPPGDTAQGPPAARAMLEYALSGKPLAGSLSHLFAQFPEIVGRSPILGGVLQAVLTTARSDIPVLIEGESGTGKEIVARAIHRVSRRGGLPFLCENCGALPENLVESEFFGHEKGAFTGADRQKPGIFERASGGTVFLDEVGEMDLSLQRKLLRVLQEKEVRRVGGQDTVAVDFRLLSATNRVLEEMVAEGKFREDLYYRLNVVTIFMPALRERQADIPLLVAHFNQLFAVETGKSPLEFTDRAIAALTSYRWPGNVRELRNEIWSHACSERIRVDIEHLSRRILRALPPEEGEAASSRLAPQPLRDIERGTVGAVILEALRRAKGNRAEAARRLGITRSSLYRRMDKYNLHGSQDWKDQAPSSGS